MFKSVTYQAPAAEVLRFSYEANFLATGEGMNPKPMSMGSPEEDYEDE